MPSIDCLDSESPRHCKDARACTNNKTLSFNAHKLHDMMLYFTDILLLCIDNAANINQGQHRKVDLRHRVCRTWNTKHTQAGGCSSFSTLSASSLASLLAAATPPPAVTSSIARCRSPSSTNSESMRSNSSSPCTLCRANSTGAVKLPLAKS
jgi:hypothetical protein